MTVVALGAWCDLEDHSSASPGSVSFVVHEFAVLADGRRVTLHTDRGFSVSGPVRPTSTDPLAGMTASQIEADVLTTVLPDEDGTTDEHPYEWLCTLLLEKGVEVTSESMRTVPYTVELSDRLQHLLHDQTTQE